MSGKFVLKISGDQFIFNLLSDDSKTLLVSERYTTKAAALNGIESVKKNADNDARYELTPTGKRFNLKAGNGQVIGSSTNYNDEDAARQGMAVVKQCAPHAQMDDQT